MLGQTPPGAGEGAVGLRNQLHGTFLCGLNEQNHRQSRVPPKNIHALAKAGRRGTGQGELQTATWFVARISGKLFVPRMPRRAESVSVGRRCDPWYGTTGRHSTVLVSTVSGSGFPPARAGG